MSDPPSYDHDLLARLNALKQTNISIDKAKPNLGADVQESSSEDILSRRLKSLRNGSGVGISRRDLSIPASDEVLNYKAPVSALDVSAFVSPGLTGHVDDELPSFLQIRNPSARWNIPVVDPTEAKGLSARADELLAAMQKQHSSAQTTKSSNVIAARTSQADLYDDGTSESTDLDAEAREAEELLAQLMDEIELGEGSEDLSMGTQAETISTSKGHSPGISVTQTKQSGQLNLTSRPSKLSDPKPQESPSTSPSRKSIDFESDINARLAALSAPSPNSDSLGLPSVPTTLPSKAALRPPSPKKKDPDDWCCVCYDNGAVICHGCDESFYCAKCWKESHTGPDSGFDERSHEWDRYRRPR